PPTITTSPVDQIVNEPNSVTLNCEATRGKPAIAVTYTWKKGSDDIRIGGRYSLNGGSLTISVTVREDDDPPTITTSPVDQTVHEPNSVTLNCEATRGKPAIAVTYTWKKGSDDIRIGGRYSLNGGSLTISVTVREDDGIYTCYASNGIGQPDSASATVTVYFPTCLEDAKDLTPAVAAASLNEIVVLQLASKMLRL
ncbi:protein turtle homolog B-like, partial [Saccoglossus kowalevskii]|uniref:Titin-like n=1 Tax=Saccoglossus kowalevskii TaxID=10224 RepID=A0ABM0LY89_SACKO